MGHPGQLRRWAALPSLRAVSTIQVGRRACVGAGTPEAGKMLDRRARAGRPNGAAGRWQMSWGPINLQAIAGNLPAPGTYPGAVADVRLHEKPDVLWCVVQFSLDDLAAA